MPLSFFIQSKQIPQKRLNSSRKTILSAINKQTIKKQERHTFAKLRDRKVNFKLNQEKKNVTSCTPQLFHTLG